MSGSAVSESANGRYLVHTPPLDDSDRSIIDRVRPLLAPCIAADAAGVATAYAASRDAGLYVGCAGAAVACWAAGDRRAARSIGKRGVKAAREIMAAGREVRRGTLLEGVAGNAVVGLMTAKRDEERSECRQLLLDVWKRVAFDCHELLYGTAGYCVALLVALELLPGDAEIAALLQSVCAALLAVPMPDGMKWHGKLYLGYAHGLAGICNTLLLARAPLSDAVRQTIEWLAQLALQFKGQMPSSSGLARSELVQWCHGAPGFVALFAHSGHADALALCLDDIWARGLLTKGVGLCHGASGSGMAFLCHFRATRDERSLVRACHFAHECITLEALASGTRQGDDPHSLFNGFGARALFLSELHAELEQSAAHVPRSLLRVFGLLVDEQQEGVQALRARHREQREQ